MTYSKVLAMAAMVTGLMVSGAQAQDRREVRYDVAHVNALRNDIATHRVRLNEALRHGRTRVAAAERREIAREEALLRAATHDVRHDRW